LSINENIPVSRDSALHADHFVNEESTSQSDFVALQGRKIVSFINSGRNLIKKSYLYPSNFNL